ncbi:MAG: hypothetical protein DRJ35_00900 [Thermoprotei archaeon]|nr:MAG: hypothetical protein DRJ35_00900 [Thermoprotei archaeon]
MPRIIRLPREGGIYGVWLGALSFALKNILNHIDFRLVLGLAGSVMFLLTLDYVRYEKTTKRYIPVVIVSSLYLPLLITRPELVLFYATLAFSFLYLHLRYTGYRTIYGSGVLALHGSILRVYGNWDPFISLTPLFFSLFAVTEAYERVYTTSRTTLALKMVFGLGIVFLAMYMYWMAYPTAALIYLLDFMVRLVTEASGLYTRMSLKFYGFVEFFRHILVLGVMGFIF